MDDRRFDDLTRMLAGEVTRRRVLHGVLAAVFGIGIDRAAAAASCPPGQVARSRLGCVCETTGRPPGADGVCPCPAGQVRCGGVCLKVDRDLDNCGACGNVCPASINPCLVPVCRNGACGYAPVVDGTPCDDGNACTRTDVCQGGVCVGLDAVECVPQDQCHSAVCDAADGTCIQIPLTGTPCDDGNPCTKPDVCQDGLCVAGDPVTCAPPDQCHQAGNCNPVTGQCEYEPKPNGTPCDDGNACTLTDVCQDGFCVGLDEVECVPLNSCHDAGVCDKVTGQCTNPSKPNGTPCDNACTEGNTCQGGICSGGFPVICLAPSPCVTVKCDPIQGCVSTPTPAGTPCGDFNRCDGDEVCDGAGNCVPGTPLTCGECATCDVVSGMCVPDNEGQPCSGNGNRCVGGFVCVSGECVGQDPVTCPPPDQCHEEGQCDPSTGQCIYRDKADGTPCDDGDPCTLTDTCQGGVCVGGNRLECAPDQRCYNGSCCTPDCRTCLVEFGDPNPCPAMPGQCGFSDGCGGVCDTCSSCQVCVPLGPVGFCRDMTESDPNNCGECGNVCPADRPCCQEGQCSNLTCHGECCGLGEYCCSWGGRQRCCSLGTTCCPVVFGTTIVDVVCCASWEVCDDDPYETGYLWGCRPSRPGGVIPGLP